MAFVSHPFSASAVASREWLKQPCLTISSRGGDWWRLRFLVSVKGLPLRLAAFLVLGACIATSHLVEIAMLSLAFESSNSEAVDLTFHCLLNR